MISLGSVLWNSLRYHFFFCFSYYKHNGFFSLRYWCMHHPLPGAAMVNLEEHIIYYPLNHRNGFLYGSDIWNWWWVWNMCKVHTWLHDVECTTGSLQWYEIHVSICFFISPFFLLRNVSSFIVWTNKVIWFIHVVLEGIALRYDLTLPLSSFASNWKLTDLDGVS
jgi:hypothetical protein